MPYTPNPVTLRIQDIPRYLQTELVKITNWLAQKVQDSVSSGIQQAYEDGEWVPADHGSMVGLGDDDHTQYHNDTRGDVRYYTKTQLDGGQLDSLYIEESEVDSDIKTLSLPANTTITTFGASLVDDADAATARTTLGVDGAGTDNSTNVTLTGTPDYITISGQVITRNQIDLANDVTGDLPIADIDATGSPGATNFLCGDGTWKVPPHAELVTAPASASASGTAGQIAYDSSYFYVCTATDTWARVAISTWT